MTKVPPVGVPVVPADRAAGLSQRKQRRILTWLRRTADHWCETHIPRNYYRKVLGVTKLTAESSTPVDTQCDICGQRMTEAYQLELELLGLGRPCKVKRLSMPRKVIYGLEWVCTDRAACEDRAQLMLFKAAVTGSQEVQDE